MYFDFLTKTKLHCTSMLKMHICIETSSSSSSSSPLAMQCYAVLKYGHNFKGNFINCICVFIDPIIHSANDIVLSVRWFEFSPLNEFKKSEILLR